MYVEILKEQGGGAGEWRLCGVHLCVVAALVLISLHAQIAMAQVTYHGFSEQKEGSNVLTTLISTPSGTTAGDLLIAAVATDGNSASSLSAPSGWNQIDVGVANNSFATLGVWWREATASEPGSHQFSWNNGQQSYGWIMRFTGHHPSNPITSSAATRGSSSAPTSPSVTTSTANSTVLRLGAFDRNSITVDAPGLTGHSAITMDRSSSSGAAVSGGAGYVVQAAVGSSGSSSFGLTANRRYRALTVAIAPAPSASVDHFAISHDGSASNCFAESITITAQDASDATVTTYAGTITLSTSTGNGDWQVGASGAHGTLTPGASDSGSASYTFAVADSGQVVLELANTHDETLNIDVAQGAYSEDPASDPDLTVAGCTVPGGVACSVWIDPSWGYRKALVVDSGQVAATLSNFPMLVSLSADSDLAASARSDGHDILFSDADGITQLDHEIESWNPATGELQAWVRVPSLSGTSDPVVYLYYGNASASDQANAPGVWDSYYSEVLHLHDDLADSTAFNNDATNSGTSDVSGLIADGQDFDGNNDWLTPSTDVENRSEVTLSVWVDADETVSTNTIYDEYDGSYWQFSVLQNRFYTRDTSNAPSGTRDNDVTWGPLTTGWHHLVFRYSVSESIKSVYVDGQLDASSTNSVDPLEDHQTGFRIGWATDGTDFDGVMDEFRLSLGLARSANWITTEYNNQSAAATFYSMSLEQTACASGPDHFAIIHDGAALNCQAEAVTIAAHDGGDSVDASYTDTIALTTSTAHGDWSVVSGGGTLTNGGAGSATYSFDPGDSGQVTLGLRNTFSETLNINVSDGGTTESSSEDADLAFAESGFVFLANSTQSAIGTQIGGKASNIAPGTQTLELQAVRTSDATGACESFLTNTLTVSMAYECENPTSCTANEVSISGTGIAGNSNGAPLSYRDVVLDFGDASDTTAAFTFYYPDVGQIQLHARLTLSPSGENLVGSSNSFVARPFAFDVTVPGNTAPSDETGDVLASAGSDFTANARAVLWSSADDSNSDGVADGHDDTNPLNNATLGDNAAALNFGQEAEDIDLDATLYAPSPGNDPGLAGGVTIATFASGSGSTTTAYYDEVGIVELSSSVKGGDYLGIGTVETANIVGRSGTVGRFTPYEFDVATNTPVFDEGCAVGAFTYLDQPFNFGTAPVITVTARSEQGSLTQNYKGVYWKIVNASLANRDYSAATGTLDDTNLPAATSDPAVAIGGSGTGTLTFNTGSGLFFARGATPVAPFDAEIRLEIDVVDGDGVAYAGNPAAFGQASAGNGILFSSDKRMRYGRLALSNAHGSELANLDVLLRAEYFNATTFISHDDDSCSSVSASHLTLTKDPVGIASTATIDNDPLLLGEAGLWLSPAGSGNEGTVDIEVDLSSATGADLEWLRFDWPADGDSGGLPTEDPTSRATFGIYKGRTPIIYMREDY